MNGEPRTGAGAPEPAEETPSRAFLALGLGLAPAAWIFHFVAGISLVPFSCDRGSEAWLHATTAAALPIGLVGLVLAWRLRGAVRDGSNAVLGTVGVSLAVLSVGLIVVEQLALLPLEACS